MDNAAGILLEHIDHALPGDRTQLRRLKTAMAAKTRGRLISNDVLLARYHQEIAWGIRQPNKRLERILRVNGIRSQSGIATVTVITEPYACPGRCVYCPTETRAPKSYLTNEPAVMRALRNDYDPYRQVISRLQTLEQTGHPTDKIELIVKGGTWSFYPAPYQRWFVQRCFEAANDFVEKTTGSAECEMRNAGAHINTPHSELRTPNSLSSSTLAEAQGVNETAAHRIIGLTIETRPDYIDEPETRRLRELGVTRVELGVQTLNERLLELIVRDHTTVEIRQATKLLRDAGLKVAYHLMPNLPGATPEDDLETFRTLFNDPAYRPDSLKIYPCVVIETAELYRWWQEGRYQPYDDETLIELLIQLKQLIPPFTRIERVIRDIPATSIKASSTISNLREVVLARMKARGLRCRCIRCREIRDRIDGSFRLIRRDYEASDGREIFLSFEDPSSDTLAALLRLRIPSAAAPWSSALEGMALIRELHTYGQHVSLHDRADDAAQHRGFGRQLMTEAERIAREEFHRGIAVIAGIGVREYYRKLGYALCETYMVKRPEV